MSSSLRHENINLVWFSDVVEVLIVDTQVDVEVTLQIYIQVQVEVAISK